MGLPEVTGCDASFVQGARTIDTTAETLAPSLAAMTSTWPPANEVPHRPSRAVSTSAPRELCSAAEAQWVRSGTLKA